MSPSPETLAFDAHQVWLTGFLLLFLVLTILVWGVLHLLSPRQHVALTEAVRRDWLNLLYVIAGVFFLAALGAAAAVLFDTIRNILHPPQTGSSSPNLGAGALIAALLGAPFVIWGTVLKHRTLGFQKEGHLTDRISKAVEQLGAEKAVERIGRGVTILTGEPERVNYDEERAAKLADRPRTRLSKKEWEQTYFPEDDVVEEGYRQTVTTWPEERTVIQWQGEPVALEKHEAIGTEGAWQVFKETAPNIEVRIGGLLSLERIAQDSVAYDNGRDHVRMMEIICAYIRNNAPARDLTETPLPFATKTPRLDIQKAIDVIKRRSDAQRALEAAARYRLDLRNTDLDGCDLSNGNFEGAIFWRARLEAARVRGADLTGAQFYDALLSHADFYKTHLRGTHFEEATFTAGGWGQLGIATIESLFIDGARMTGLHINKKNAPAIFGSKNTTLNGAQDRKKAAALKIAEAINLYDPEYDDKPIDEIPISDTDRLFLHWTPYADNDLASGEFRKRFIEKHGLTGWPFED